MQDQDAHRVILNARQDLDHPQSPSFARDFDSAIGITRNFPFTAALNIYPVPSFKDTLKRPNHVKGPIYHDNVRTLHNLVCISLIAYWLVG